MACRAATLVLGNANAAHLTGDLYRKAAAALAPAELIRIACIIDQ